MKTAVLLIDLQNDYFPDGAYPLWNTEAVVGNVLALVERARGRGDLLVHVQHVANPEMGIAPFFNEGTEGAAIWADVLAAAPDAPIVVKQFADAFEGTNLEEVLAANEVEALLVCGMMTQNCVTHTAISKAAEKYETAILTDCCTTVDEMLHQIALHAVSTRMRLTTTDAEYA